MLAHPESKPIAYSEFVITSSEQIDTQSSISIWRPELNSCGIWECQVCLEGILPPITINAGDSLQSLCLAINFARKYLESYLAESGSRIRYRDRVDDSDGELFHNSEYRELMFGTTLSSQ
jgi:hypothetical protein